MNKLAETLSAPSLWRKKISTTRYYRLKQTLVNRMKDYINDNLIVNTDKLSFKRNTLKPSKKNELKADIINIGFKEYKGD